MLLGVTGILNHVVYISNNVNDLKQWAEMNDIKEVNYIVKRAVCNKNMITVNGVVPLEFAKEILKVDFRFWEAI